MWEEVLRRRRSLCVPLCETLKWQAGLLCGVLPCRRIRSPSAWLGRSTLAKLPSPRQSLPPPAGAASGSAAALASAALARAQQLLAQLPAGFFEPLLPAGLLGGEQVRACRSSIGRSANHAINQL